MMENCLIENVFVDFLFSSKMKIAIEGCAHGELNKIYESVHYIEKREGIKIDLLICCGDFQSVRNHEDMISMAVPPKYREMKDFPDYYTGKRKAPVLTLFIGGNHEAARYLWELPYGGWVAENIFYLGFAGVVNFAGLRIGGLSGIYKHKDFYKGHFEMPPFSEDTKRSFYHVRSSDVAKLKLLVDDPFDIFLSHDWPKRIYHHGDSEQLIRFKPFLKDEINSNSLGSEAAEELLKALKPTYWFSGHMHAKFSAIVEHSTGGRTKFLALDKCLPRRNFLQVIDVEQTQQEEIPSLRYDKQWVCVLRATKDIFSKSNKQTFLTELSEDYKPNSTRIAEVEELCDGDFSILPFSRSVDGRNEQTSLFCERFELFNPCSTESPIVNNASGSSRFASTNQRRLSLPKPVNFEETKPKLQSTLDDEDDFSELTNPNISSNPDEITISGDESSSSDSGVTNDDNNDCDTTKASFIETPYKTTDDSTSVDCKESGIADVSSGEGCSESTCGTDEKDSCGETPIPKKKFKLVRRNQEIYTPSDGIE